MTPIVFGEMLAYKIQDWLNVPEVGKSDMHIMDANGNEVGVFPMAPAYGLMGAVYQIVQNGVGSVVENNPGIKEYAMDIFEDREAKTPYLQIDVELNHETKRMKIRDVRFPGKEFWAGFNYDVPALTYIATMLTETD